MLEKIRNLFKRKPKGEIIIPIKTNLNDATEAEKKLARALIEYLREVGEV